jgi:hypothetical protein
MLVAVNAQISLCIGLKISSVLRRILWNFVIYFLEEIYNEILIKMFRSAGGLWVTDKIKFKIMTSRYEAHYLFKNHLYRNIQRKVEAIVDETYWSIRRTGEVIE